MQTTAASNLKAPKKPPLPKPGELKDKPAVKTPAKTVVKEMPASLEETALKPPSPAAPSAAKTPQLQLNKAVPEMPTLKKAARTPEPIKSSPQPPAATPTAAKASTTQQESSKSQKKKRTKAVKKASQKQIPTILGLLILVVSLVAGVLLFGDGTGVFAPRATPETTPQNIQTSNLSDQAFTVSFFTDEATVGYVKYGTDPDNLKKQASDDRDQLSGMVKPYRLHQVTLRGLQPSTTYYYILGTGTKDTFDNNGVPYQLETAATPSNNSPNNQTIYGKVSDDTGAAAEGAIVYVDLDGVGTLSTLVKSSGSWAISLSNAFNLSFDGYPDILENSALRIKVQGVKPNLTALKNVTVATAQPAMDIVLGESSQVTAADTDRSELLDESIVDQNVEPVASDSAESEMAANTTPLSGPDLSIDSSQSAMVAEAIDSSSLAAELTKSSQEERTLNLMAVGEEASASATVIKTTQPVIETNLPANITVQIEVHSDTQISQTAQTDANGNVSLDVAALGQNLEPGEHTATYSYIDPLTGEEVVKSYTFVVADDAVSADELGRGVEATGGETASFDFSDTGDDNASQTLANTETYGSGNPYYPTTEATTTPTVSLSPTASPSTVLETNTSTNSTTVSTASGTYNAGSTLNTLAMIVAGFFFIATGLWSFLLAKEFKN